MEIDPLSGILLFVSIKRRGQRQKDLLSQLAFFINLQRAVIGPSATLMADNGPL